MDRCRQFDARVAATTHDEGEPGPLLGGILGLVGLLDGVDEVVAHLQRIARRVEEAGVLAQPRQSG